MKAFEAFAVAVPNSATQDMTLVYDPFTPRTLLQGLISAMAQRNVRLSLINASRDEAEKLLASGQADLGSARRAIVAWETLWSGAP